MSETNTLHDKLIDIQQNLKVPKTRENDFGGFSYRSVEDIEVALKPSLKKHSLTLTFEDEMIGIEGRVYVKAWAILSDGQNEIRVCAYAREAEKPKAKTDDAQLTGGCSSYARKYAAQGLFLIDDGKSDPDNPAHETAQAMGVGELNIARQRLFNKFKEKGITDSDVMMEKINKATGKDLVETVGDVAKVIKLLDES
jgi:hypothetical protein